MVRFFKSAFQYFILLNLKSFIYLSKRSIMIGSVSIINSEKNLFSVKHDNETFSIVEYLEPTPLSKGDVVRAQFITGDVFVNNETKNIYFEGYIHHL